MRKPSTVGLGEYTTAELIAEINERFRETVNRFEVIDKQGRAYVKGAMYGSPVVPSLSLQDEERTVKVFIKGSKNE